MPCEFVALIVACAPLFSKPVFQHAQVLLMGAILAPGRRTVTAALRVMGLSQDAPLQHDQRVLHRALWAGLAASQVLRGLLVSAFAPTGTLVLGLDDTIERRRGEQITVQGLYRAPGRSSHAPFGKASGLRWLCLRLLVEMPWADRVWALPFLTALCPSERDCKERGRAPRPLTDRARQRLLLAARWLPGRELVVTPDSSVAAVELLEAVRESITVVTRLRLEAALYEPAPARRAGQMGRPRQQGKRLPTLARVAADRQTKWPAVTVPHWYGAPQRTVEVGTGTCVWYHAGLPAVPIRWVLIRDPQEQCATQAWLSTKLAATPQQILAWFVRRWQIAVPFEEARAHLGLETQRQWSEKAIARTPPCVLGLYAFVSVLAARLLQEQSLPATPRGMGHQTARDLLGHAGVCAALVVESATFSEVEHGERRDKSPTRLVRASNRDALLCCVNG